MNKVLPLLIVPPLFLIFFLNVENLTVKIDDKLKTSPVLESTENTVFQNKKDEEITNSNENLSNKNGEKKLDDSIKDSKPELKSVKSISENDLTSQDIPSNLHGLSLKPIMNNPKISLKFPGVVVYGEVDCCLMIFDYFLGPPASGLIVLYPIQLFFHQ